MTLLQTFFEIERNQATGKKQYIVDGKVDIKPTLPYSWQTASSSATLDSQSFVIRCDDIVVVDCDSLGSTQAIDDLLADPDAYVVVSDKGEKHFYFTTTEKFDESPLKRRSRLSLAPIDLMQGQSLVFPVCPSNTTKTVFNGSIEHLTPIPDSIVDYLISLLKTETIEHGDYKPNQSFMAPQLEIALGLFGRTDNYKELEQIMKIVTPYKYVQSVKPDYHPDRIPDGEGTAYIQALSSKIAGDVSISPTLHREVIAVVTQELWSDPFSNEQLDTFLSNLTTQKYPNGNPVFVYDTTIDSNILISIGDNEPTQLYRTAEDEFLIPYPAGGAKIIKRESNLIKTLGSKNYNMFLDGNPVAASSVKTALQRASDTLTTVEIINEAYSQSGFFERDNISYFNMYTPTKYLGIIRGEYRLDRKPIGPSAFPTIMNILNNITLDHEDRIIVDKINQFTAMKAKNSEHSPIVLQLLGARGIGKDSWVDLVLGPIFGGVGEIRMSASNSQFNADYTDKFVVKIPELIVNPARTNELKNLSGNRDIRQEAKGKDARMVKNINTYITSSNKPALLAETPTDRRFVLLSGWKAKMLKVVDLDLKVALELEEYCLYLRDMKMQSRNIFYDANLWHDTLIVKAFEEEAEHFNNATDLLAALVAKKNTKNGVELYEKLEEALGAEFHFWLGRMNRLCIPLSSNGAVRLTDNQPLTHSVTARDLKQVELTEYVTRDKNKIKYDKAIYYLWIQLTTEQLSYFQAKTEGITPIAETL